MEFLVVPKLLFLSSLSNLGALRLKPLESCFIFIFQGCVNGGCSSCPGGQSFSSSGQCPEEFSCTDDNNSGNDVSCNR